MKNKCTWSSVYREQKHRENMEKKAFKNQAIEEDFSEREIAILLDVQGTLDNINVSSARLFMRQVEFLRKYFKAQNARIVVSSYVDCASSLRPYLEILHNTSLKNIVIEDAFYLHGTYHFENDEASEISEYYNKDKFARFKEKYLYDSFMGMGCQTVWFSVVDDELREDFYKKFRDSKVSFFCKPSLCFEEEKKYDNFMSRSTLTKGFDGVIECFDSYIKDLKTMNYQEILEHQKNMLVHLSRLDIQKICNDEKLDVLLHYLEENKIDDDDYQSIFFYLKDVYEKSEPTMEELVQLKKILFYVKEHLKKESVIWSLILEKNEGSKC